MTEAYVLISKLCFYLLQLYSMHDVYGMSSWVTSEDEHLNVKERLGKILAVQNIGFILRGGVF